MGYISLNDSKSTIQNADNDYYQGIIVHGRKGEVMNVRVKDMIRYIRDRRKNGFMDSETETYLLSLVLSVYVESRFLPVFGKHLRKLENHWMDFSYGGR